jgi:hypothetical protein
MGPGATVAPSFKDTDATAIAQQIGGIQAVAPEARSSATVVAGGRNWSTSVIGSTNDWLITGNWKLGRAASSPTKNCAPAPPCASSAPPAPRAVGNSADVIGQQLRVKGFPAGDRPAGLQGQGAFGNDQDDTVLIPLNTLQRRVTGSKRLNTILVSMEDGSDPERVKASLTSCCASAQAGPQRRRQLQRAGHQADRRHHVGHHQGDDHAAGRGGRGEPAGGRHRHHEHHAGERDRAHPRDRLRLAIGALERECCCSS